MSQIDMPFIAINNKGLEVKNITKSVNIPVIATGGMGHPQNLVDVIKKGSADAVAMGHVLHYAKLDIIELKQYCKKNGISTR